MSATIALEAMPDRVQAWAAYRPLEFVVRLMQALWAGGSWSDKVLSVVVLAGILAVAAALPTSLLLGVSIGRKGRSPAPQCRRCRPPRRRPAGSA